MMPKPVYFIMKDRPRLRSSPVKFKKDDLDESKGNNTVTKHKMTQKEDFYLNTRGFIG